MLTIRQKQMDAMTKAYFYEELDQFVSENSLRDDWKTWMSNNAESVHEIWDADWPRVKDLSEHDCALYLVLLAIYTFEGVTSQRPSDLRAGVASNEIQSKQYMADRGYLHFTAFDYPAGTLEED